MYLILKTTSAILFYIFHSIIYFFHPTQLLVMSPSAYLPHFVFMMTSSNGNISMLLALCAGNSQVPIEFPSQRPVTESFDVFFDLHLNKRLSKQSRRRWFEMPLHSLWCHCNVLFRAHVHAFLLHNQVIWQASRQHCHQAPCQNSKQSLILAFHFTTSRLFINSGNIFFLCLE